MKRVKEGFKTGLLAIFPFVAAGILQKNKTGLTWKGILMGVISGILWFMLITTQDTSNIELQKQLESRNDQIFEMSQILENQETDIEELTDQLESVETNTKNEIQETKKEEKETLSQKNAVKTAKNYIDFMPFSRSGLIKQLEFDGYSKEDSIYAVDKIGLK